MHSTSTGYKILLGRTGKKTHNW